MAQHSDVGARGRKRPAECDPDEDQPLAKKFDRLHIGHYSHQTQNGCIQPRPNPSKSTDSMMLDDTKHTIYIHDLEQELAETEPLNDIVTILPGLEEKLSMSRILSTNTKPTGSDIILYNEPSALSTTKEQDNVRKALMETRERARLAQSRCQSYMQGRVNYQVTTMSSYAGKAGHGGIDADDMDIDVDAAPESGRLDCP